MCSIIGIYTVKGSSSRSPEVALRIGTIGASLLYIIAAFVLTYVIDISANVWGAVLVGALGGIFIGLATEYYTGGEPVRRIARGGDRCGFRGAFSNGSVGCLARRRLARVLVEREEREGNHEHRDDHAINAAARLRRDRLGAVDVLFLLQALGRHLVDPRKDQREWQPEQQKDDDRLDGPVRRAETVERQFRDLGDDPRDDRVREAHAYDVPAL